MKNQIIVITSLFALIFPGIVTAQSGTVGQWSFNEGNGQIAASSDGTLNGVLGSTSGADSNDPTWTTGVYGGTALHFSNSYVRVPNSPSLEPVTITLEAWIRADSAPPVYTEMISKGAQYCQYDSYRLKTYGNGILFQVLTTAGDAGVSPETGPAVWDGKWHHYAGTYDGSMVRLYLDGVEVGSGKPWTGQIVYNLPTHNDLVFGAALGSCGPFYFTGDIDEVKVWNRPLTAEEIGARFSR